MIFINRSGYRSIFFYSAMYSIFALLAIPFCHQHQEVWAFKWFFYVYTVLSLLYIVVLYVIVILRKSDISCRGVLWWFILFSIISTTAAYVNDQLPSLIQIPSTLETIFVVLYSNIFYAWCWVCCFRFRVDTMLYSDGKVV